MKRLALSFGLLLLAACVFLLSPRPKHEAAVATQPVTVAATAREAVTSAPAVVPATGQSFEEMYALQGHAMRLVTPPFSPLRRDFLSKNRPGWEPTFDGGSSLIVSWKEGKPEVFGIIFANDLGFVPRDLVERIFGYNGYDIEADRSIIAKQIVGDIVFDADASRERLLEDLANIIQQERGKLVIIKEVEVDFPTVVLKGKWHYTPLPEGQSPQQKDAEVVEVYGEALDAPRGMQSAIFDGDADWFSKQVANVLQQVIAIEPTDPPGKIHYHFDYWGDGSPQQQKAARDMDLVLRHICDQTGLTRVSEVRKRKRLVFREPTPAEQVLP